MAASHFQAKDWSQHPPRRALTQEQMAAQLAALEGWTVIGDAPHATLEKTFRFDNYFQTMAFVNAVAWMAHQQDHHPSLQVEYARCTVCWNTHDAGGVTTTDFDCAQRTDTLVSPL